MDVVKTNIARLGGVVDVESDLGIGTKMTITPHHLGDHLDYGLGGRRAHLLHAAREHGKAIFLDPREVRVFEGAR